MTGRITGLGGHQSARAGKDEWLTPRDVLKALGPFDLDPCAPVTPPWPIAAQHYTIQDNGLCMPWNGFVFCNPPYGQVTGIWLERLRRHGNGIALVFARTETDMFFEAAWSGASSMFFIRGRLYFHHVTGERASANSGAPSVLLGYGPEADRRLARCGFAGALVQCWRVVEGARAGEAPPSGNLFADAANPQDQE